MAVVAARQLRSPAFRRRTPLRRHRSRLAAVSAPIVALLAGIALAAVIGLGLDGAGFRARLHLQSAPAQAAATARQQ